MKYSENTIFVAGISKTGKEDGIHSLYQNLSVGLVVDQSSGQILALDCTIVMGETVEFLRQLLVGRNLFSEMDDIARLLERRFLALSQKAMIAALYDAQNRFRMAYPEVFRKTN